MAFDLIRNGTLSAEMAATLWAAVDEQRFFVVAAAPRLAGKSTTTDAMLALVPPEVPVHRLSGDERDDGATQGGSYGRLPGGGRV